MVAAADNRTMPISVRCCVCDTDHLILVNPQDLLDWTSGSGLIQDVLGYLSVDERELLISMTCGKCFDIMFGVDD